MGLPNKTKGEVSLPPEAGKKAHLQLTLDAMERFYGELGDQWLSILPSKLMNLTPPSFLKTAVETMLVDGDIEKFPFGLTIDEIKTKALDAISYAMNGKDFMTGAREARDAEVKEKEEFLKKKLAAVAGKTGVEQIAAILSDPEILSMLPMNAVAERASVSTTSEGIPSTTSSDTPIE